MNIPKGMEMSKFAPYLAPPEREDEPYVTFPEPVESVMAGVAAFDESLINNLSFNMFKPELSSEEDEKKHRTAVAVGDVAGEVVGTLGALYVTGGTLSLVPWVSKVMSLARTGTKASQVLKGRAVGDALMFGTYELVKETGRQIREKDLELWEGTEKVGGAFLTGKVLGVAGAFGSMRSRLTDAFAGGVALATAGLAARLYDGEEVSGKDLTTEALVGFVYNAVLHRSVSTEANRKLADYKAMKSREKFAKLLSTEGWTEDDMAKLVMESSGTKEIKFAKEVARVVKEQGDPDVIYAKRKVRVWEPSESDAIGGEIEVSSIEKIKGGKKVIEGVKRALNDLQPKGVTLEGDKLVTRRPFEIPSMGEVTGKLSGGGSISKLTSAGKMIEKEETFVPLIGKPHLSFLNDLLLGYKTKLPGGDVRRMPGMGAKEEDVTKIVREAYGKFHGEEGKDIELIDLTQGEAEHFLKGLTEYIANYQVKGVTDGFTGVPSRLPLGMREPGIGSGLSNAEFYSAAHNFADFVGPLAKAKNYMNDVRADLAEYLHYLEKLWIDLRGGIPIGEKARAFLSNKTPTAYQEMFNVLTGQGWDRLGVASRADFFQSQLGKYSAGEQAVLKEMRLLTETALMRHNEALEYFGYEPIRSVEDYLTRIYKNAKYKKGETFQPAVDLRTLPEGRLPNPTEHPRTVEDPDINTLVTNPFALITTMWNYNLKTMVLTNPVHAVMWSINHINQMGQASGSGAKVPDSIVKYITDYTQHVVMGWPHEIDSKVNRTLERLGIVEALDMGLAHLGRSMGSSPAKSIASTYGKAWDRAFIAGRPKFALRNAAQVFIGLAFNDFESTAKAMLPRSKQPQWMLDMVGRTQIHKKTMRTLAPSEDATAIAGKKIDALTYSLARRSQIFTVDKTALATAHQIKEFITNPKYAKVGYRSKQRTGHEPDDFFYLDEMEKMEKEVNWVSMVSQGDYSREGLPLLFGASTGKFALKYLSYSVNMVGHFSREAFHRAVSGHPTWDTKGEINLPTWQKAGMWRLVTFGVLSALAAEKAGIDVWSSLPWGAMPERGGTGWQFLKSLTLAVGGPNDKRWGHFKNAVKLGAPLPLQNAILDAYKASKPGEGGLKGYFTYRRGKKEKEEKTTPSPFGFSPSPSTERKKKTNAILF